MMDCNSRLVHNITDCKDNYPLTSEINGKMCVYDGDLSNENVELQEKPRVPTENIKANITTQKPPTTTKKTTNGVERNLPHFTFLVMVAYLAM